MLPRLNQLGRTGGWRIFFLSRKKNLAQNLYSMTVFLSFFVQNSAISTDALLEMIETR